jgi:hypothetical protein
MIPIFIICKDRVTVLKECIESYKKLGDVDILLIDNGSTYPPMVEYLNAVAEKVYVNLSANGEFVDISDSINAFIDDWFKYNDSDYYIVTDPDILLENPGPKLIDYYKEILDKEQSYLCVGPMLRIDDLPECFGLKNDMIKAHKFQFWDKESFKHKESRVQPAMIDTTFAMYRKGFRFKRLNLGIRVHEPYMAKHLDWYIDTNNLTDEQKYYFEHASKVSSMGNHLLRGAPV